MSSAADDDPSALTAAEGAEYYGYNYGGSELECEASVGSISVRCPILESYLDNYDAKDLIGMGDLDLPDLPVEALEQPAPEVPQREQPIPEKPLTPFHSGSHLPSHKF